MSRRRALSTPYSTGRREPCPLTADDVYGVLALQRLPVTTTEVTEFCEARFDYPGVTTDRVRTLLSWLARHERIETWGAEDPYITGHPELVPEHRKRYWAIP